MNRAICLLYELAGFCLVGYGLCMSAQEIAEAVMALPEEERLELARRIVESVETDRAIAERVAQAVPGIEDIITGKLTGLSEDEFRDALK